MRRRHRWALTTWFLAWTWAVAGGASAASPRTPLVVAVEQGADVAPDDVRSAVAGELGEPVVGPNDPAPPDARRIEVRSRNGVIHVAFRDARGHTIERELTAPADGATRVRMIALLAGNLARNEAADLVAHPDPDAADAAGAGAAPAGGADSVSHVNIDVAPGQELRVRLAPAAAQKGEDAATASDAPPASKAAVAPTIPPSSGSAGSTQRTLGWIGIGTGAAAVGVGIALRVMAAHESGSSIACIPGKCSPQGMSSDEDSMSKFVASNWALAIGGALAATGVILELTAPSSTSSTRIAIGPTGIVLARGW